MENAPKQLPTDSGNSRQEHTVLFNYLPGQIVAHIPKWKEAESNLPSSPLIARVSRISPVTKLPSDHKVYKESEPKVRRFIVESLREAGSSFTEKNIIFYNISSRWQFEINVELEVFPDTWEVDLQDHPGASRLFKPGKDASLPITNGFTKRPNQTYVLFCGPKRNSRPFIDEIHVPDGICWISNDSELENKRILFPDGSSKFLRPACAKSEKEDHLMRPRFPYDKSNFIPKHAYDVYLPDLENARQCGLLNYWRSRGLIDAGGNQNEFNELAKKAVTLLDMNFEEEQLKIMIQALAGSKKTNIANQAAFVEGTIEFSKVSGTIEYERLKVYALKDNADVKNDIYDMFNLFYSENLEIGIFSVGYFAGKYDNPEDTDRPKLRRFDGGFIGAVNASEDCYLLNCGSNIREKQRDEWPVFYQTFKTEGILVSPTQKTIEMFHGDNDLIFDAIHALSHSLIKNIPNYSGIDSNSIREHFFDTRREVLIYSAEPGKFRSKGLRYLFDSNLHELFLDAKETLDCPFQFADETDTESHIEGCGACTMIPSVGCIEMNRHLNRAAALTMLLGLSSSRV